MSQILIHLFDPRPRVTVLKRVVRAGKPQLICVGVRGDGSTMRIDFWLYRDGGVAQSKRLTRDWFARFWKQPGYWS